MEKTNVILINNENELTTLINENDIVIVDFYADWCAPCRALLPVLDELSLEKTEVKICKVNCEEMTEIAQKNQIRSLPTLMFYKNGENVDIKKGFVPKNQLIEIIENL